jgi:hypothetical protein
LYYYILLLLLLAAYVFVKHFEAVVRRLITHHQLHTIFHVVACGELQLSVRAALSARRRADQGRSVLAYWPNGSGMAVFYLEAGARWIALTPADKYVVRAKSPKLEM